MCSKTKQTQTKRSPAMKSKVKNIIKNYPCTVFLTLLILLGIIDLLVVSKVYADTGVNTPGCYSERVNCTSENFPQNISQVPCSGRPGSCNCGGELMYISCNVSHIHVCNGKVEGGCSSRSCKLEDCKDVVISDTCGECTYFFLNGRTPNDNCSIKQSGDICLFCIYESKRAEYKPNKPPSV